MEISEVPKISAEIVYRELEGEVIAHNTSRKTYHSLNGTASMIFLLCDGKRTVDDIRNSVLERYSGGSETENQIANALSDMAALGLITGQVDR